ncbi:hypothetical protein ACQP3J_27860, partial [Escherichia coli]
QEQNVGRKRVSAVKNHGYGLNLKPNPKIPNSSLDSKAQTPRAKSSDYKPAKRSILYDVMHITKKKND